MASRKTAGAAAKKQAEAEPTLAVTPNEPVQEVTAQEPDKEKEPPAAHDCSAAVAPAGRYETFEDGCM